MAGNVTGSTHASAAPTKRWRFEALPDIFEDLNAIPIPEGEKVGTQPALALRTRTYPSDKASVGQEKDWPRFTRYIEHLNKEAPANVSYKLLYLTRHGIGFHNQKHREVGSDLWNNYWSLKDGDSVNTWFDSFLTNEGVQQAKDLSKFWLDLMAKDGAPLPQTLYTSPMARCLQTTLYVFGPLMAAHQTPFKPIVKENLRERWTLHTCDKRRTRSWIEKNWADKGYVIEDGFAEEDQLGVGDEAESDAHHVARKQKALEDIFEGDSNAILSLTVHSIAIRAIQEACQADQVKVSEGSSIALLVKGERSETV